MAPPVKAATVWSKNSMLVERLKEFYYGKKEAPPLISEKTALLCALLFTIIYVAPFYLSSTLRTSPLNSRDSPTVIKARTRAVGLSCLASAVVTLYVLVSYGHATPRDVLRLFAMWPIKPFDCLRTLALVVVLFMGPLYELLVVDGSWRELSFGAVKEAFWDSPTGHRALVTAPVFEELVFRSLVISLYQLAKVPPVRIVFLTPLVFGIAHLHHMVEFMKSHTRQGDTVPSAKVVFLGFMQSFFQFTYTSLFGFFAGFVFLRTGNVFAAVTAHTFCNFMGFPRIWGRIGQFDEWEGHNATPDLAQGKRDDGPSKLRSGAGITKDKDEHAKPGAYELRPGSRNFCLAWTVIYYLLLPTGAYAFHRLLWKLTESENALVTF